MYQDMASMIVWRYQSLAALPEAQCNPNPHKYMNDHNYRVVSYQHIKLNWTAIGHYAPSSPSWLPILASCYYNKALIHWAPKNFPNMLNYSDATPINP